MISPDDPTARDGIGLVKLIGRWHGRFVHVPMRLAVRQSRKVDTDGDLWMSVIEATGQPRTLA